MLSFILLVFYFAFKFMECALNLNCVVLLPEQKEKLSEVEQQLKKAEAAQRRRVQVEKAARESEVWPPSICSIWWLLPHLS